MELSELQKERYSRHLILKEIGEEGQKKLLESSVLIFGAGGLGSPAALYLASAGVGKIGIVDADVVDLSNLQRQIIHAVKDIGKPKAVSAKESIQGMNPDVEVVAYPIFADETNIDELIRAYDFILDCTDNFTAKFLINDACVQAEKPFVHAGIIRFGGQIMTYVPGQGPCYRCIFQSPPPEGAVPACKEAGIIGVTAGVVGSLQAAEAVKYLLGIGTLLTGTLLTYDGLTMAFRKVGLPKYVENCPVCGKKEGFLEE